MTISYFYKYKAIFEMNISTNSKAVYPVFESVCTNWTSVSNHIN